MTDHPSSDRDELVVAYLDGEATPAERAVVEADPELMARVEILGEVMAMVGEPVMPPPPEVRRAHIAAALEASDTAPNVASLATRRRRFGAAQIAAVAAVVVALFAIPFAFTGGDDDTETAVSSADDATEARSSDGLATAESAAGDDGAAGAELFQGDEAAAEEPAEAAAEEPAEAPAAEPAEEPLAETDADAELIEEESAAADDAGDAFVAQRLDVELAPTLDELRLQVLPPPDGIRTGSVAEAPIDDLGCVLDRAATLGTDDRIEQAGTALVGNQFVQYAVLERQVDGTTVGELVVFDEICAPILTVAIG